MTSNTVKPCSQEIDHSKKMVDPAFGKGILPPLFKIESVFNRFVSLLPIISAIFLIAICTCITIDSSGRLFFNKPWNGITDLEPLFMTVVGFFALALSVTKRESIQIDLLYNLFPAKSKQSLFLFGSILCCLATGIIGIRGIMAVPEWSTTTFILLFPEWPVLLATSICIVITAVSFFFHIIHSIRYMLIEGDYRNILLSFFFAALIAASPFIYKATELDLSCLAVGGIVFLVLFTIMLLGVPLGFAMAIMGIVGLLMVSRWPEAAFSTVATIPFTQTANFMLVALPMFLLMGDMVSVAGLSGDLFNVAEKWLGRFPGGLAIATVFGCAGFGAVCGDSMATALAMTTVAMPSMRQNKYNDGLSVSSLAAGGTLGILIPPSMGFIVYSMITDVSVGKLFQAGIIPGCLLALIFMVIIIIRVKLNPEIAPLGKKYSLKEKIHSLMYLVPVITLFFIVVYGILAGKFTPAEGGAIGAVLAFVYAIFRRKLNWQKFVTIMFGSAEMFGKMFSLFIGLYIFGSFLGASRLPTVLAETISSLDINRYVILAVIVVFYIIIGCVMNIMPMMMLTLPSIYPTVEALGFNGVWFGVVAVILMEMGMITPPVGMNVLTLATILPDVRSSDIFKGVLPFVGGMLFCVILLILFPQIALFWGS